ncbi:MAG: hypothetical protein NC230_06745 [Bacteroides sp.]|nr:hypothetical protein [Bacteroides sp.]
MKEFEESEAIAAMRVALPEDLRNTYSDDELFNLLDIVWDYYEQNGLLDVDLNDDDDDDDDQMFVDLCDYARRMIRKDRKATLDPELIEQLVAAEIEYENSLL